MLDKPLALLAPSDTGGCGFYRVIQPGARLAEIVGATPVNCLNLPDIRALYSLRIAFALTQRQDTPERVAYWKKFHEAFPAVPLIVDWDDLVWDAHPLSPYRPTNASLDAMDMVSRLATHLVASTEPLRQNVSHRYRRPAALLPNLISEDEFHPPASRSDGERLKVLWAGSDTHGPDLEQIIPTVIATLGLYDWIFMGYVPVPLVGRVRFVPAAPMGAYMDVMRGLGAHVGITPLIDTAFNRCKSHLKLLEYGAAGLATISSPVAPYLETGGLLVTGFSPQVWLEQLSLLEDDHKRLAVARASQAYAAEFIVERHDHTIEAAFPAIMGAIAA